MTRVPLRFEEIRVRRAPGFEREGFTIPALSPGVNLVHGPNGVGKSTTARAVARLLWPSLDVGGRVVLAGRMRLGEERWEVEVDGERVAWLAEGAPAAPPRLPTPEGHRRYHLSLHDLLLEADDDFAAAIAREAAGGYDVRGSGEVLSPRLPSGRRASRAYDELQRARAAYETALAEQRALREREGELHDLRRRFRAADAARRRRGVLAAAIELARARAAEEEARLVVEQFDRGVERVGGEEYDRLCALREKLRAAETELDDAERALDEQRGRRAELGLSPDVLAQEVLEGLERDLERLAAAEEAAERLRIAHSQAEASLRQGAGRLGAVADPERLAAVALDGIGALADFGDRAERIEARRAALEAQLDALPPSRNTEDAGQLERGLACLGDWLRAVPPKSAPVWPVQRIAGAAAAGLLVLVGMALGGLVHPGWLLLTLAGVVLLVLVLHRPAATGSDAAAGWRQRYSELRLGDPTDWNATAVAELIGQLTERLRIAQEARRAADRRADLERQLAKVTEQAGEVEAEGRAVVERLGIQPLSGPGVVWVAEAIGRWQRDHDAVAGHAAALEQARRRAGDASDSLRVRLERLGRTGRETSGELAAAVRAFRATREECLRMDESIASAVAAAAKLRRDADGIRVEIEALFRTLELEADRDETVRDWCASRASFARARDLHRDALTGRSIAAARLESLGGEPSLGELSLPELEARFETEEALATARDSLHEEIARTEEQIAAAMRSHDVETALAEIDRLQEELRDARDEEIRAAVAHDLIEALERETRDQHLPAVFLRARQHFSIITRGRYELRLGGDAPAGFAAFDTVDQRLRRLDELSSGTRVQLLLAVRVAFVEEQEDGAILPLMLDEVLGNSDDERARAVMDAVVALAAAGRQVVYFTAQADEVARWRGLAAEGGLAGVELREIDLAQVRGDERRLHVPDAVPRARPRPPYPDGATPEEYARLIGVPPIDRAASPAGAVHLWYLVDEPRLLYSLLELGTERWGPLAALLRDGGRELVADDFREMLEVRARAVEAFLEAARLGVGLRVDRHALEQSGGVSDVFLDRVAELADEVGGDAQRILESLESGAVTGFRRARIGVLREYLEEHGYLVADEPLELSAIHDRVMRRVAPDVASGRLSADDLSHLVGRLWAGVGGFAPPGDRAPTPAS